jgi:hypothetical protein
VLHLYAREEYRQKRDRTTASLLEAKRLIRSTRRQIVVHNRRGLIEGAHGSYGAVEEEYRRLIGSLLAR